MQQEELKSRAISFCKSAAIWLLSSAFVLILSAALISHVFVSVFFEPAPYLASFEKHGLYGGMRQGVIETFSQRMPPSLQQNVSAAVSRAMTEEHVRLETNRLITNFLAYLSARSERLDMVLDVSPIAREFAASQDAQVRSLASEMPTGLDFAAQMRATGQLERLSDFRSQVAQARGANAIAIAASFLLLVPIFLLYPSWQQGLSKCLELILNAGVSTFIGGAIFAFLSPVGLPFLLGVSSANQGIANAISLVMADVLQQIGVLVILYSLPLMIIGFGLPRMMHLPPPNAPIAPSAAQNAPDRPISASPAGSGPSSSPPS